MRLEHVYVNESCELTFRYIKWTTDSPIKNIRTEKHRVIFHALCTVTHIVLLINKTFKVPPTQFVWLSQYFSTYLIIIIIILLSALAF